MSRTQAFGRFLAIAATLGVASGCSGGGAATQPASDLTLTGSSSTATANQTQAIRTDDGDLSKPGQRSISANRLSSEAVGRKGKALLFRTLTRQATRQAAPVQHVDGSITVSGQLQYADPKGAALPAENVTVSAGLNQADGSTLGSTLVAADGRWSLALPASTAGKHVVVTFTLANQLWNIQGNDGGYAWQGPDIAQLQGDTDTGLRSMEQGSTNAQAAFIHEIWNRYARLFAREQINISWWSRSIDTNWPADGDYYSGSVNLTEAAHWDVNGHEIGHAITFTGTNTHAGGGQHYIDRCYDPSLAWSEGVASFLSAAVSVDHKDPNAKFEFMVPRRAPLGIETVPDDVCKGHGNEWRVYSAMWDVLDLHDDGSDRLGLSFATIWKALHEARSLSSIDEVFTALVKTAGQDKAALIKDAFKQNTIAI